MMNSTLFFIVALAAQVCVVWLSYSIGREDGWLDGWDQKHK